MADWTPKDIPRICETQTEWIKIQTTIKWKHIGRAALCAGCGIHLLLFDLETHLSKVHTVEGDGIAVYTGNPYQSFMAYAEKRLNPNIYIKNYPALDTITTLEGGCPEGYVSLSFTSGDYIVCLGAASDHKLTIWNWRLGDLAYVINTIPGAAFIKCSSSNPAKIFMSARDEIKIWDICYSFKKILLLPMVIQKNENYGQIIDACWNSDGYLFILNDQGAVFTNTNLTTFTMKMVIDGYAGSSILCNPELPAFQYYKNGIIIKDKIKSVKHYDKNDWSNDWTVGEISVHQFLLCVMRDSLYIWTADGDIREFNFDEQSFEKITNYSSNIKDFELIFPTGDYFVTCSLFNTIQSWKTKTGELMQTLFYEDKITCISANCVYPYLIVGFNEGHCQMLSVLEQGQMKIETVFYLSNWSIDKIRYNRSGDTIVAANMSFGFFFVMRGIPGENIEVCLFFDYRRSILDYTVFDTNQCVYIHILVGKGLEVNGSNKIVMKFLNKTERKLKKKVLDAENLQIRKELNRLKAADTIDDDTVQSFTFTAKKKDLYSQIVNVNGTEFYIKPSTSKTIRVIDLKSKKIRVKAEYTTGHMLRHVRMNVRPNHVITWGYDGLVTIRSPDLKYLWSVFMTHHRYEKGVKKAKAAPNLKYIISLGEDGTLLCINQVRWEESEEQMRELASLYNDNAKLFLLKTVGFIPEGIFEGKNYMEIKTLKSIITDESDTRAIRNKLHEHFARVKKEEIELLEMNERGLELEKIPLLEFYLHKKMKRYKEEMAEFECEWIRRYSLQKIEAQDRVAEWIKNTFWDRMDIPHCELHGLGANISCENYVKIQLDPRIQQQCDRILIQRKAELLVRNNQTLLPWLPVSEKLTIEFHKTVPGIKRTDEHLRIREQLDLEEDEVNEQKWDPTNLHKFPSTTAIMFVEQNEYFYTQTELHTFDQITKQITLLANIDYSLRDYFNKLFDELMSAKVRDMQSIKDRNERLRYILSELKNDTIFISDPVWIPKEKPESIIKVETDEVSISPYISPSEQAILDAQAAEAERIRLALLADDFKERALIDMMHGVLEIRWEDTIKRDIPKPKFMLEKNPEEYTEEEIRLSFEYEEKVAFLMSERQRYKNMLEAEYEKISESIRETYKKYNKRLRELILLKINVETGRLQETLHIQRLKKSTHATIQLETKEKELLENIKNNELVIIDLHEQLSVLTTTSGECQSAMEAILLKERQLERLFKKDISDYSLSIQTASFKIYKKHPRATAKNISSLALLYELGRCCVTQEITVLLTSECIDYLKSLDALDQYVGVPNNIDENLYKIICKHRRAKIENDFKIKANHIEQQDLENTFQVFNTRLSLQKEYGLQLEQDLAKIRDEIISLIHNKELQIVIKSGLVEIPMNGNFEDFEDAIMVKKSDVQHINSIILNAGERKLKVMNDKMIHRRGILLKEWKHKCMNMEIEDLKTTIHNIANIKVTKEIQLYLKNKAKGISMDKGLLTLDQEIELIRKSYERIIMERKYKVDELQEQIDSYTKKNKALDKKISDINIDICEQQLNRNIEFEKKEAHSNKKRMAAIVQRSSLVKQIQEQHNEILMLQTELELLRLKTYPSLKFKTLD